MKPPEWGMAKYRNGSVNGDPSAQAADRASVESILATLEQDMVILEETLRMELLPDERSATVRRLYAATELFKDYKNRLQDAVRAESLRR